MVVINFGPSGVGNDELPFGICATGDGVWIGEGVWYTGKYPGGESVVATTRVSVFDSAEPGRMTIGVGPPANAGKEGI